MNASPQTPKRTASDGSIALKRFKLGAIFVRVFQNLS
jgi:hypothetical protein